MTFAERDTSKKAPSRYLLPILTSVGLAIGGLLLVDIGELIAAFLKFPPWLLAAICILFSMNLMVVAWRLFRILALFGTRIDYTAVSRASLSGHVAGLALSSLLGQIIGRHAVLRKHGVSSIAIASATTLERIIILISSGSMAVAGLFVLGTQTDLFRFLRQFPGFEMGVVLALMVVVSTIIGRSRLDIQIKKSLMSLRTAFGFSENLVISLVAQAIVLSAFALSALAIDPDLPITSVFAAAAIVSFAASIPISINGWGVREIASIYVFGQLGLPAANALALSVLVGICSTITIIVFGSLALGRRDTAGNATVKATSMTPSTSTFGSSVVERTSAYIVALMAACLIFFQIHVDLNIMPDWQASVDPLVGTLNVNLADPIALVAFAAVLVHGISTRRLPRWRVPHLSLMLIGIGLMLVLGLFIAIPSIGVTQWALISRLFGWLVILGYVGLGYMLVFYNGTHVVRRTVETMVATMVMIVLVFVTMRYLQGIGYDIGAEATLNFEGLAGNRNSYAFQALTCIALLTGYTTFYARAQRCAWYRAGRSAPAADGPALVAYRRILGSRLWFVVFALAILIIGVILSGSRAGIITGAIVLAGAWIFRQGDRRILELGIILSAFLWFLPDTIVIVIKGITIVIRSIPSNLYSEEFMQSVSDFFPVFEDVGVQSKFSTASSQLERLTAIRHGLGYWMESPVFGKGLGYFLHNSTNIFDKPVLLHNTPVWLLTEFGLVGLTAILVFLFVIFVSMACRRSDGSTRGTIILLAVVALFCMTHDIFYQRIFWFALGLCAAGFFGLDQLRRQGGTVSCHIITGLGAGGAERMLTRLVTRPTPPGTRQFVVSLMNKGVFGEQISASGTKLYTLGISRDRPSPLSFMRLLRILWQEKPDVIMTWLYHADFLGALSGWLMGVGKIVWNLRCSDMSPVRRTFGARLLIRILAWLSPFPERTIINSEAGRRYHESIGYEPNSWQIIGNGVDCDLFRPDPTAYRDVRVELGIPQDALIVGNVARFHPMKDYDTLLAAIAKLQTAGCPCHFVLVGKDIDWKNPFFSAWLDKGLGKERVHLIGSRTDIPRIMAAFDTFVLSSAYGEGAPNVVIEAMSCGVPGVVTDVGDAGAILGDSSRTVPTGDSEALARALITLIEMPTDARRKLGRDARARVKEHFDIEAVNLAYQDLLFRNSGKAFP